MDHTSKSPSVETATDLQTTLVSRGIAPPHAKLLSCDRQITQVEAMSAESIAIVLSVSAAVAAKIYESIHNQTQPFSIRSRFNSLVGILHMSLLDYVSNITRDSNRFDLASLWSKSGTQPPIHFIDLSNDDADISNQLLSLLVLHPEVSPALAASLEWIIDGHYLCVTGVKFSVKMLGELALEMASLGFLLPAEAEFLSINSSLLPPSQNRDFKQGDRVASIVQNTPLKSFAYRKSCSDRSHRLRWPPNRRRKLGIITYNYISDNIFDVAFDDGFQCPIHGSHMVRVISSQSSPQEDS